MRSCSFGIFWNLLVCVWNLLVRFWISSAWDYYFGVCDWIIMLGGKSSNSYAHTTQHADQRAESCIDLFPGRVIELNLDCVN